MSLTVGDTSGYDSIPGSDFGGKFDYPCSESEEDERCMIHGPLEVRPWAWLCLHLRPHCFALCGQTVKQGQHS